MISISLDEGYIFDILSIYEIKLGKNPNDQRLVDNFRLICREITQQIGEEKFLEVVESQEYKNLLQANLITFEFVDKAKESEGLAKEVDASNYKRYQCKVTLQKRFFNSQIAEIKIGYTKD